MTDDLAQIRQAVSLLKEKKGERIVVIDLTDVSIPTSHFIIVETDNAVHAKALVNVLRDGLGIKTYRTEGESERRWIVLDYGDFVVHVFEKEAREFYDIESLWADHIIELT